MMRCARCTTRNPALARLAYRVLTRVKYRSIASGKPDLDILCVYHMPFRGLAKLSGGIITMDMARALLVIVNGHFIKVSGSLPVHISQPGKRRSS